MNVRWAFRKQIDVLLANDHFDGQFSLLKYDDEFDTRNENDSMCLHSSSKNNFRTLKQGNSNDFLFYDSDTYDKVEQFFDSAKNNYEKSTDTWNLNMDFNYRCNINEVNLEI